MAGFDAIAKESQPAVNDNEWLPDALSVQGSVVVAFSLGAAFRPPKSLFVHGALLVLYFFALFVLFFFGISLLILRPVVAENLGRAALAKAVMLGTLVPLLVVLIVGAFAVVKAV